MKITTTRIIRFGLLIAWLGLTIFLSEQSGAESARMSERITNWIVRVFPSNIGYTRLHGILRELAHFGIHFILAILAYRALVTVLKEKASVALGLLFCGIIAVIDELTQSGISGRARESFDLLLNLFGVSLGTNLSYLISNPISKSPR